MTFALPVMLLALALVPLIGVLWVRGQRQAARGAAALSRTPPARPSYVAAAFALLAVTCAIVAAAQPRWGTRAAHLSRSGSELIVVMDVSRSMDATDAAPSRLEAAKKAVNATIDRLGSARVGLVVFGGSGRLRFPLTSDFQAARQVVSSLEAGQVFVTGGTSTALGLDEAFNVFDFSKPAGRAVLLVTDGDNLGDDPSDAATKLRVAGVDLMVAGVGTADGATVPITDPKTGRVTAKPGADGKPIVTRLNEPFLRAVAGAAAGRYLGAEPSAIPGLVEGHMRALESARFDQQATTLPVERYPWFAGAALALLLLGSLSEHLRWFRFRSARVAALAVAALLIGGCATSAYSATEAGREALRRGDAQTAVDRFTEARAALPNDPRANLNLAVALHAAGRYDEAIAAARRATTDSDPKIRAQAFASIGHHEFAAKRLPGALADFKLALLADPGDDASRHDYEVVLALLTGSRQQNPPSQPGDSQQPANRQPGGSASPDASATPGSGPSQPNPSGGPQAGTPGQGDQSGGAPSPQEIERQLRQIDSDVSRILKESGDQPTSEQALEILRLLQERSKIAGERSATGPASGPSDY